MLRNLALLSMLATPLGAHDAEWPEPSQNNRPLVRWWWPADLSAIDEPGPELEQLAAKGFGGVEIHSPPPIHAGRPAQLDWLGSSWIDRFSEAAKTADRLGLKLDLAVDGPSHRGLPAIPPYESAIQSVPITAESGGGPFELDLPDGSIDCLGAWPSHGPPIDLRPFIDLENHKLQWEAPPGSWSIYGIGRDPANFPDPLSTTTAANSLARLADAFLGSGVPFPRSYTIGTDDQGTDWSSALVPGFLKRRGYDLREQLPALFGDAESGTVDRVTGDYRETLSDLRRDSLITWHKWAHDQGCLSRTHVDGIIGNPVDIHGVPDIPGMILAGLPDDDDLPMLAFAPSAAHLHTKPLIGATILHATTDPSRITPAQMKETADLLWLAGANQLILDGIVSGSDDVPLNSPDLPPITSIGPGSGRWKNLQSFNSYLTRCQSILQSGAPDPEVLLYYPAHDLSTERGGIPDNPRNQSDWFRPTAFHRTAQSFIENGIPCDYVSDLALHNASVSNGRIILGGLSYKTLILPGVRLLPETTSSIILELTRRGAKIAVLDGWPRDVPGFPMPDIRRGTLFTNYQDIQASQILEGDDPVELVRELGVIPEAMASHGLRFIRRSHHEGRHYFIVNRSGQRIDQWIPLSLPTTSAVLMDPRFLKRAGIASTRQGDDHFEVHLTLEPGESRILRTFTHREATGPRWENLQTSAPSRPVSGIWKVAFIDGGPELPDEFESPVLGSWTTLADPRAARFSGTARYVINFHLPHSGEWLLDLGQVADTARVFVNGNEAGSVFAPPHQFDLSRFLKAGKNTLTVEVTNLRQPEKDRNLPPLTSGLLGPVRLIPLNRQ